MWIQKQRFTKFVEFQSKKHDDTLVMERPLTLTINDTLALKTTYTPSKEKDFGIGFCIANGYIQTQNDIESIKTEPGQILISLKQTPQLPKTLPTTTTTIKLINIYELTATFQEKAMLFKDTAISESSAIAKDNKFLAFSEDISQLNAFYKSLGTAELLDDFCAQNAYVLTSGKIDELFITTIARCGFKIIISRTAPTALALKVAEEHDIVLIGFARGRKCNVYTLPERIIR